MDTVRIDSKGRITLPRELREALRLEPGDVLCYERDNGGVRLAKAENPFDVLADYARQQRRDGRGITLREFAEAEGLSLNDE